MVKIKELLDVPVETSASARVPQSCYQDCHCSAHLLVTRAVGLSAPSASLLTTTMILWF